MIYGSVCSGIEAASVAWEPLGWNPAFFSEIEPFPCAVLKHRHPDVPNHGDLTRFQEWPDHDIDLLVGGTPCQSFSVAGLRKGLRDPRGNLALTYLAVADRYRPKWVVWENVPGVLSSHGGRDFGSFLGALAELGYGWAYRVLDAQYVRTHGFHGAVPQRRRRVFVVGCLGDARPAQRVLLEPESLRGNPPPRREARKEAAGHVAPGLGFGGNKSGGHLDVATARNAHAGPHGRLDFESETFIVAQTLRARDMARGVDSDCTDTLVAYVENQRNEVRQVDAAMALQAIRRGDAKNEAIPLEAGGPHTVVHGFNARQDPDVYPGYAGPLDTDPGTQCVHHDWVVRRLTPTECERLQGFPDGHTQIPWRGKNGAPDGPRYKAIGNSMAVNVMRWIGERIRDDEL